MLKEPAPTEQETVVLTTTESNLLPKSEIFTPTRATSVLEHDDNMILTSYETRKPIVVPRIVSSDNNNAKMFSISSRISCDSYKSVLFTIVFICVGKVYLLAVIDAAFIV